jgi:CSLREA domain-containing protein
MFETKQREPKFKALAFGLVVAFMAGCLLVVAGPAHAATTFTVNSTRDVGDDNSGNGSCFTGTLIPGSGFGLVQECTLRAAIEEANATSGADTINFNIPSTGVNTISVGHQGCCRLPAITEQVTIDGYSQPGSMPNTLASGNNATPKIELDGTNASPGGGLNVATDGSVIKGLVINRFLYGVVISGPTVGATAKSNRIEGNFIGTDASGTQDLGNVRDGVAIFDGANNTIGGTEPAARNIISGNGGGGGGGVLISSAIATGNKVMGNYIGTDKTGTQDLGNSGSVYILEGANNTIGGTTAAAGNTISANNGGGVSVVGLNARGNSILSNSINNNQVLGIALLANDGVTANDSGDADNGPNAVQNYPVITSATTSSGQTTIKGTLNSIPNRLFDLQFFSSPTADPSGFGEGQTLVGETLVDTDPNGDASFDFVTPTPLAGGQVVSATATDQNGNTSEFSRAVAVVDNTPPNTAPTITPLSPLRKTRTTRPLISAKVSDAQIEFSQANMTLFVDNRPKAAFTYSQSTDTLTYKSTKLKAGRRHTVRIEANDGVLSTTRSWYFKVIRRR